MSDPISLLLIGRVIERVGIVVIAGICVVLGWKLFSQPLGNDGEADIRRGALRLTLKRIGPGVFFALFGAVTLSVSLFSPITLEVTQNPTLTDLIRTDPVNKAERSSEAPVGTSPGRRTTRISAFEEGPGREETMHAVRALNTAIRVASMKRGDSPVLSAALDDLSRSKSRLERLRDEIVADQIGDEALDLWRKKGAAFTANPNMRPETVRRELARAAPWFEQNVNDDR